MRIITCSIEDLKELGAKHDYRLKEKDKWTKKEFEKIFIYSHLIWPSSFIASKSAPTNLLRVYVEVRTPYDGIVLEGIINKLARKDLAQYHEAAYATNLSGDERGMFGKNLTEIVPDRVTLDLNTEKMSKLKKILEDLQKAKDTIVEFTKTKGIGTKRKMFQLRHTGLIHVTNYFLGDAVMGAPYLGDKLSDFYDKKNILPTFEKFIDYVDPEYLNQDLDKVTKLFATLLGGRIGAYIHDKVVEYQKKKNQKE